MWHNTAVAQIGPFVVDDVEVGQNGNVQADDTIVVPFVSCRCIQVGNRRRVRMT